MYVYFFVQRVETIVARVTKFGARDNHDLYSFWILNVKNEGHIQLKSVREHSHAYNVIALYLHSLWRDRVSLTTCLSLINFDFVRIYPLTYCMGMDIATYDCMSRRTSYVRQCFHRRYS